MYHIFICLSVDEHVGCFQVLAILYSAAMHIGLHVSFSIIVFSEYLLSGGLGGSVPNF